MSDIYIPVGSFSLDKIVDEPQIRLGLQGPPGVGKTFNALSFPNPIVLNFDRGLGAHIGRSDVIEVPFWNPTFVDKVVKRDGVNNPPNRKDALTKWLLTEGMKLSSKQTVILDSNTQIQNAYHIQYKINPVIAKSGRVDDFAEWSGKTDYFAELMEILKSLQCNVVYICHETDDRDKTGELNGKIKPMMTGQFADQLASHFTDHFRCHAFVKPTQDNWEKAKIHFKVDDAGLKELMSYSTNSSIYVWETASNEIAKHIKTSSLVNAPRFVVANYNSFGKYKRK